MTPFVREMLAQRPNLIAPVLHAKFANALEQLKEFGRIDSGGSIVAIVGPSQAGKSLLVAKFLEFLTTEVFRDATDEELPIIGASAQTSREGRTAPKFIYEMLLADCGSPLFDLPKIAQAKYRPVFSMAEGKLLTILTQALRHLHTKLVFIDEAQYLVRAKDEVFRSALLESLKSLVSGTRSLVLIGGYEFVHTLLGQRAHLAARSTIVHLERYDSGDWINWLRVLKSFKDMSSLTFANDKVLEECSERLLTECHGVVGILSARLLKAHIVSAAAGRAIDVATLVGCGPTIEQWETIASDIKWGEQLLRRSPGEMSGVQPTPKAVEPAKVPAGKRNPPFTTSPRREMAGFPGG